MSSTMAVAGPDNKALGKSTQPAVVQVQGLNKSFPVRKSWPEILRHPFRRERSTVLENVSLSVHEGEFFGLLGQNGAGKTTLFRILSTLVLPDSGSVSVAGLNAASHGNEVRKLVAPVIASERSLNWRLTAHENLRLYAVLQRVPASQLHEEVNRVLNVVALNDTGNKMVGTFSSGMRQRLLIARALLGRPRILLLDEPTRSLDPISARDFRRFLRQTIVREQGCTVLLATHDADDVWNLCDRVAVLHKGALLAVDNTAVLRARVGDAVHRIWVNEAQAQLHAELAQREGIPLLSSERTNEEGWVECALEIAGGSASAASYLARVQSNGISVARFEKSAPDLAELIERVVRGRGAAA
jgi:ABC-2 type transport system ATP-binding protein